jgi:hypothetical protein
VMTCASLSSARSRAASPSRPPGGAVI